MHSLDRQRTSSNDNWRGECACSGAGRDRKEGDRAEEGDNERGEQAGEVESQDPAKDEPARYILKEVLSYHRVMEGELEVAVFGDKSHPFIPGERTVVRVRLVG